MQFIERFFGLSPDGGSGSLEVCVMLIPFAIALLAVAGMLKLRCNLFGDRQDLAAEVDVRQSYR